MTRPNGAKLTPDDQQAIIYSHRHYGAELLLDDMLEVCEDTGDDLAEACAILARWDRSARVDSRGTQVWTEFWERAQRIDNLYAVPFDAGDPVNTPSRLNIDEDAVRAGLIGALAEASRHLEAAGIEGDAPWGEVQFAERHGERIPIPGAPGRHGVFSYIETGFTKDKGYTPIATGNSYIQVVTWDQDGAVDARGILSYSQSPESDSPHYADQTRLYSRGEWLDLPFTEEEIMADPKVKSLRLQE